MFDRAIITVKAGNGGNGIISFLREKFVPFGGPAGGNGGKGGDVIIKADPSITSLKMYSRKKIYRAEDGKNGGNKKKHGAHGADLVLAVPVGTAVFSKTPFGESALLADLAEPGQEVIVAKGGRGGFGNAHYTSATHQAPRIAQRGEPGEEQTIILELRLIADVGIIGYPNAGKSTFLSAVTAARPKIADYPFTTLEPVLGAAESGGRGFILAEIPGLIAGAHLGKGLGHDFLRHAMRTKMFLHLIDGTAESPVDNMIQVNNELALFDSSLSRKPQIVVVNKIDVPAVRERQSEIRQAFREAGVDVFFVSAKSGEGLPEVIAETARRLSLLAGTEEKKAESPVKVFRPQPVSEGVKVHKDGNVFIIEASGLDRLTTRRGEPDSEVMMELKNRLNRLGVNRALVRAGIKPGDKVRCGSIEWEWS